MYAVLVADSNINPEGSGDPELVGLFPTFDSAAEWANQEPGWIVQVLPVIVPSERPALLDAKEPA